MLAEKFDDKICAQKKSNNVIKNLHNLKVKFEFEK